MHFEVTSSYLILKDHAMTITFRIDKKMAAACFKGKPSLVYLFHEIYVYVLSSNTFL